MKLRYPLHRRFPTSSTFQDHLDRTPPSTAPGLDIAAPLGEPVFAVAEGYVEVAEGRGAGGIRVWINHGRIADDGSVVKSYSAHLSVMRVMKGQRLKAGQYIGNVGSTGHSTGPHLHLSIKVGGGYVDPEPLLDPP